VTKVDACNAMLRLLLNLSHHCDDAFTIAMKQSDFFLRSMGIVLERVSALRTEFSGLGSSPLSPAAREAQVGNDDFMHKYMYIFVYFINICYC
jgi:hypothetical protein